jgi:hypothetical protein
MEPAVELCIATEELPRILEVSMLACSTISVAIRASDRALFLY